MEYSLPENGIQSYLWLVTFRLTWTVIAYVVGKAVYNIYFHPLSKFPGPKLFAASYIPREAAALSGHLHLTLKDLHEKYGDIVRTGPNVLTFTSAQAWKDIYTRQGGGSHSGFPKDSITYSTPAGQTSSILTVINEDDHTRYRHLLSHAFSEKALQEQSPLIKKYVDLLIARLHENAGDEAQDMTAWFNFVAFDIIGDLSLGESFGCLQNSEYHPWVSFLFSSFKVVTFFGAARRFPPFASLLLLLVPKHLVKARNQHRDFTREKVLKRIDMGTERGDFMSNVLKHNDKETGMTSDEMVYTFATLLMAGSETTATLLSVVTFYLLQSPHVMKKLKTEIRTSFQSEDEITQKSVNKLQYQLAVLEEALRIHSPTPWGFPRVVPGDGKVVDGHWLPGGTTVYVPTYAATKLASNWKNPESFIPERFLDHEDYRSDKKGSFAPFSLGARNCIGVNLAYAEMRLILARLLWNFDLELDARSENWTDGMKMYILWEKPALYVKLKPVTRT
ncbi:Cytochrome P450 monooxygenase aclL [Lachnellula suecica]|uniref:Cytochrome P450 monooxygenase aclL n=1 Tax=Lachnellula suecica TaxID=602035 RepID=A0A8T9BWC0_9HELO|nr:Cytochrome P450 monooxygenase aclL [Lachnellula suecica]